MDQGLIQHRSLILGGRWAELPFCGQMGNIGSEVSRACYWKNKGQEDQMFQALWRGLELLTKTIELTSGPWRRELCRAREVLNDYILGDNEYQTTERQLMQYFDDFALSYQCKYRRQR